MIIVRQKNVADIHAMVAGHKRVLLVGCNTCAAVALAGGEREVETLVETLRLAARRAGSATEYAAAVLQRQCEPEFTEKLELDGADAILSLGCGAGVAFIASQQEVPVYPALDTLFIGAAQGFATWEAECSACGSCVLGQTAGICPMTRCAKGIMNGPCGGTMDGKCELGDRDCAWVLIYERLEAQGRLDEFGELAEPKDHSVKSTLAEWTAAEHQGGSR